MLCFVQEGKELLAEKILAIIENPADCLHALFDLALRIGGDRILASLTTLAVDGMTKLLEVLSSRWDHGYLLNVCLVAG